MGASKQTAILANKKSPIQFGNHSPNRFPHGWTITGADPQPIHSLADAIAGLAGIFMNRNLGTACER